MIRIATSSPGRFSPPRPQSQGKAPWGRGCSYRLKLLLRHTWKNANSRNRQEKFMPEQEKKTKQTENMHPWRTNKNLQAKQNCVPHPRFTSNGPSLALPFERRTPTGSETFSLLKCLEANKFVFLSFFSLIKAIYLRVWTKPLPSDAKNPLPVHVLRSKTLLLKLPNTEPLSDLQVSRPLSQGLAFPLDPLQKGTTLKCSRKGCNPLKSLKLDPCFEEGTILRTLTAFTAFQRKTSPLSTSLSW